MCIRDRYYVVSNILMTVQSLVMKKIYDPETMKAEVAAEMAARKKEQKRGVKSTTIKLSLIHILAAQRSGGQALCPGWPARQGKAAGRKAPCHGPARKMCIRDRPLASRRSFSDQNGVSVRRFMAALDSSER